jgi:glucosamine--fructose-6-phosphate aminotransferase (isomerizing)
VAITDNAHSSMALEAYASLPIFAGPELAIPATKSFTTQLVVLYSLALFLSRLRRRMTLLMVEKHCEALRKLPLQLAPSLDRWIVFAGIAAGAKAN